MDLIKSGEASPSKNAPQRRLRVVEGSCWPCKDRRVLCDLSSPSCKKCAKANLQCAYGKIRLRWANSAAPKPKASQQTHLTVGKQLSPLDNAGNWQICYFEVEILPRFSMPDGSGPAMSWMATDKTLHQAIVAISDAHRLLQNHTTTESYQQEPTASRAIAIKSFRQQLAADSTVLNLDHAFLITVLLCILDGMILPCADASAALHHLQGGKAILHQYDDPSKAASDSRGIQALLYSCFGTMDLTSAILGGQAPYFDRAWWEARSGKEAWWNGLNDDRDLMNVMGVWSSLALLGHQTHSSGVPAPAAELLKLQIALEQTAELTSSNPSLTEAEDYDAVYVAAYRASAKVYMYRALCNLPISHELVVSSLEEGLRALTETTRVGKLAHCLIFPEVIMGSHCTQNYQQRVILQAIESTAEYLSFESTEFVTDFLKMLWSRSSEDDDWWTTFEPIARKGFFF